MAWAWSPITWFADLADGASAAASSWLSSVAGDLAAGLEAGMVGIIGDLFDVIIGPLEIAIGVGIVLAVLGWAFKNQIIQLGGLALRAAV